MDRGAWWATVHRVAKSQTRLSNFTSLLHFIVFSILAAPVSHQQCRRVGSLFSTVFPAYVVCRLFDGGHYDQCEVMPRCSFGLYISNNEWCWASFHMPIGHLLCPLRRNVCLGLLPILIRLFVYFEIELYQLFVLNLFWKLSPCWSHVCKYFLPVHRFSFHFVCSFLCYAWSIDFWQGCQDNSMG